MPLESVSLNTAIISKALHCDESLCSEGPFDFFLDTSKSLAHPKQVNKIGN